MGTSYAYLSLILQLSDVSWSRGFQRHFLTSWHLNPFFKRHSFKVVVKKVIVTPLSVVI